MRAGNSRSTVNARLMNGWNTAGGSRGRWVDPSGVPMTAATVLCSTKGRAALGSSFGRYLEGTPAEELARTLGGAGLAYALIGGQAVNCWAVPRITEDFDFVVLANRDAIIEVEAALRALEFEYDRRDDAGEPSGPDFVRMVSPQTGVIVDLQTAKTDFQEAVVHRAATSVSGTRVATAEDLVVMKLIAGRSKDNDDIRRLLEFVPALDLDYVRTWARIWDVEARLDGALRWLGDDRPGPPP